MDPIQTTGAPAIEALRRGEYSPGARGLKLDGGHMSIPTFGDVEGRLGGTAVPAPMERPPAKRLKRRVREWYDRLLVRQGNPPLQDDEGIPQLLLLIVALYQTQQPEKHDCLECMKHIQFEITSSLPIMVRWEHQVFWAVPYEVRTFPLHVAISFLERARTHVFADVPLWDERREKAVARTLRTEERTTIGFRKFREPTELEQAEIERHRGLAGFGRAKMAEGHNGDSLLVDFGQGSAPVTEPTKRGQTGAQLGLPGDAAGSAPMPGSATPAGPVAPAVPHAPAPPMAPPGA